MVQDKPTDTEMLDFLDSLTGEYTGRVILRKSATGRGWRLHESSKVEATKKVRDTIRLFMIGQGWRR